MTCSICKNLHCRANVCRSDYINTWIEKIRRYWICGYNNSDENDIEVQNWARTTKFTRPLINRICQSLKHTYSINHWFRIPYPIGQRFSEITFYRGLINCPIRNIKEHLLNYNRPQQVEINMAELREEIEQYNIAQREIFILEHERTVREHVQANRIRMEAERNRQKGNKIQIQMDNFDKKYFIDDSCPVCLEKLESSNVIALNCGHTCCVNCMTHIISPTMNKKCPCCRDEITTIRFKPDIDPTNFNTISTHVLAL